MRGLPDRTRLGHITNGPSASRRQKQINWPFSRRGAAIWFPLTMPSLPHGPPRTPPPKETQGQCGRTNACCRYASLSFASCVRQANALCRRRLDARMASRGALCSSGVAGYADPLHRGTVAVMPIVPELQKILLPRTCPRGCQCKGGSLNFPFARSCRVLVSTTCCSCSVASQVWGVISAA